MTDKPFFTRPNNIETVAFLILCVGVFVGVYAPLITHTRQTPTGTLYAYAEGYLPDYYQYLSWVKEGAMGKILFSSRYTEKVYPPAFVHTMFPLIGIVGNLLGLPSYSAYTFARILSNIIFLFALAYLVRNLLLSSLERSLAYLFLLVATGVWSLDPTGSLVEAIPWSGNFNIVGKFFLPPHHLLSLTFLIVAVVRLLKPAGSTKNVIMAIVCGIVGGLLNPSLLTFFILFIILTSIFLVMRKLSWNPLQWVTRAGGPPRRGPLVGFLGGKPEAGPIEIRILKIILLFLGISSAILLYNSYLFQNVLPWSRMYILMRGFNPQVSFISYLFALGPMLPPAALAIFVPKVRSEPLGIFLLVWAFLPLLLFHFLGNPLPMNASRLFQSYQYVPLAILAAAGVANVSQLLTKAKIPLIVAPSLVAAGFFWYALTPFTKGIKNIVEPVKPWYINAYIPKSAIRTFEFLDKNSPKESVVLASEAVSTMIPAFTHNRVLLGRDDVAPDYYEKREKAFAMLDGRFSEEEARKFLQDYKVSYILFGFDAQQLSNTKNVSFPFLEERYTDEGITLVAVHR